MQFYLFIFFFIDIITVRDYSHGLNIYTQRIQ